MYCFYQCMYATHYYIKILFVMPTEAKINSHHLRKRDVELLLYNPEIINVLEGKPRDRKMGISW